AEEMREIMADLGFRTVNEMIGRSDRLEVEVTAAKHAGLDLSKVLYRPDLPADYARFQQTKPDFGLEKTLDKTELLEICRPALESGKNVSAELDIQNTDRAVGTILGSEISRKFGADGLRDDTIKLHFKGSAGQSFGA